MAFDVIVGRNESDKKDFGDRGLAYLGKSYVKMGNYTSLSNPIYMDIVRTHVVLIAGKRGGGKCLCGESLVSLEDGTNIKIKDLNEDSRKIISLNNDLKLESAPKSDFFSRKVDSLLKIKLKSGKEIKLTPEHPLLTIKGWVPAKELGIGKRIATPRKVPFFGNKEMPIHEVKLLSYLIAEGHTKSVVLFSNKDELIVNDFKKALNNFDYSLKLVCESDGQYRVSKKSYKTKVISSDFKRDKNGCFVSGTNLVEKRTIRKLIERESLFGKLAKEKKLSNDIFRLKKELLSLFLNRLFSCDGSIYKSDDSWRISYASSSKKLICQVQSLLLKYGILSKLRNKKNHLNNKIFVSYELVLSSVNVLKFISEIGFFGKKQEISKDAVLEIKSKIPNTNIDTIPKEIWENYKPKSWAEIGRKAGYKHPKAMRERTKYPPSRQTLLQVAEVENHNLFQKLALSDIFWDEIVSIDFLKGEFEVFDISVPKNHNFIANDIIVHNSYTIGVMAEALSDLNIEERGNIASLIFDTMGIYWTMKYKNQKDTELLKEWGLKSKNIPLKVFAPSGYYEEYIEKGISIDSAFAIKISEMHATDWINIFELRYTDPIAVVIETVISNLQEKKESFSFKEIINAINSIEKVSNDTKNSVLALFDAAKSWKVFDEEKGTTIKELIKAGQTTVIDLSMYASLSAFNVRALIIGLVSKKLFDERMNARKDEEVQAVMYGENYSKFDIQKDMPLTWIFVDEAHEFLPNEGKTPASDALIQVLREGRQPGLSLVLATQQPGKIHSDVMTQSDIIISHRLTAEIDVKSLNSINQSYLYSKVSDHINTLPRFKGAAVVLDDNSERVYSMRVRPRFTWHGGEAPISIKKIEL